MSKTESTAKYYAVKLFKLIETDLYRLLELINSPGLGHVSNHLISFIASGETGPMAILNLRKTCQATKRWVDELSPPSTSKRIFSQIIAHVDLDPYTKDNECSGGEASTSETGMIYDPEQEEYSIVYYGAKTTEALKRFQEFPPPPGVTSLHLNYPQRLRDGKDPKDLVEYFLQYWSPKLDYLHVDKYFDGLTELFPQLPQLRFLRIDNLETWPEKNSLFYQLPLEEFSIRTGDAGRFVDKVEEFEALKPFYFSHDSSHDWEYDMSDPECNLWIRNLESLLRSKLNDQEFEVIANPVGMRISDNEATRRLIDSVVKSKSTIRFDIKDDSITKLLQIASGDEFQLFCECIEDISCCSSVANLASARNLLSENAFPNLIRLRESCDLSKDENLQVFDVSVLPRGLQYFKTSSDFSPSYLPQSLVSLHLSNQKWTTVQWQDSLAVISETCSSLKELKITMEVKTPLKAKESPVSKRSPSFKRK